MKKWGLTEEQCSMWVCRARTDGWPHHQQLPTHYTDDTIGSRPLRSWTTDQHIELTKELVWYTKEVTSVVFGGRTKCMMMTLLRWHSPDRFPNGHVIYMQWLQLGWWKQRILGMGMLCSCCTLQCIHIIVSHFNTLNNWWKLQCSVVSCGSGSCIRISWECVVALKHCIIMWPICTKPVACRQRSFSATARNAWEGSRHPFLYYCIFNLWHLISDVRPVF